MFLLEFFQRRYHTGAGEAHCRLADLVLASGKVMVERPLRSAADFGNLVDAGRRIAVATEQRCGCPYDRAAMPRRCRHDRSLPACLNDHFI